MQEIKTLHQPRLEIDPKKEDLDLIGRGIDENNVSVTGQRTGYKELVLFVRDSKDEIIGGVRGSYNASSWLYVSGLWVSKEYRSLGYGTLLMYGIEAEAVKNGCANSHLYTIGHQAPEFYNKIGYVVFATLEKFHQGYSKIFFRKDLKAA
jgi:predicted GNAT family acetyltransferase